MAGMRAFLQFGVALGALAATPALAQTVPTEQHSDDNTAADASDPAYFGSIAPVLPPARLPPNPS